MDQNEEYQGSLRASSVIMKTDFIYCYNTAKVKHAKAAEVSVAQCWEIEDKDNVPG